MTNTHSTIETSTPSDPVRRFECPGCTFALEVPAGYRPDPRFVDRGDPSVDHTGALAVDRSWNVPALTYC